MSEKQLEVSDDVTLDDLIDTYRLLKARKPNDRSERDRRWAVTITEYEKVVAYFKTFVIEGLL